MDTAITAARVSSTQEFTNIVGNNLPAILVLAAGVIAFFWLWRRFRGAAHGK